jgi:RinA family phage transcriptional activator
VEQELRNYPYLRRELDEIRQDIIEAAATQDDLGVRIQSNGQTSVTERKGLALESNFRIRRLEGTCKDIERALERIPDHCKEVIKSRYWGNPNLKDVGCAMECHMAESTFRKWKKLTVEFVAYHMGLNSEIVAFR